MSCNTSYGWSDQAEVRFMFLRYLNKLLPAECKIGINEIESDKVQ